MLSLGLTGYIKEWLCEILLLSVFFHSQLDFGSQGFSCGERLRRTDTVK